MEEENREEEGGGSQGKKSLTKSVASPQEASNVVNPEADYLSEKSEVKKPKGENTSLGVSEYTLKNLKSSTPEQPEPEAVKSESATSKTFCFTNSLKSSSKNSFR